MLFHWAAKDYWYQSNEKKKERKNSLKKKKVPIFQNKPVIWEVITSQTILAMHTLVKEIKIYTSIKDSTNRTNAINVPILHNFTVITPLEHVAPYSNSMFSCFPLPCKIFFRNIWYL